MDAGHEMVIRYRKSNGWCFWFPQDPWDWYIYLHLLDLLGKYIGKYASPMDPMGFLDGTWMIDFDYENIFAMFASWFVASTTPKMSPPCFVQQTSLWLARCFPQSNTARIGLPVKHCLSVCRFLTLSSWSIFSLKRSKIPTRIMALAILRSWPFWDGDLWPFKRLNDLKLGDQKVTLNHLGQYVC